MNVRSANAVLRTFCERSVRERSANAVCIRERAVCVRGLRTRMFGLRTQRSQTERSRTRSRMQTEHSRSQTQCSRTFGLRTRMFCERSVRECSVNTQWLTLVWTDGWLDYGVSLMTRPLPENGVGLVKSSKG